MLYDHAKINGHQYKYLSTSNLKLAGGTDQLVLTGDKEVGHSLLSDEVTR